MEHKNPLHFTIITVTPSVDVLLFCHFLLLIRADLYRRDCIACFIGSCVARTQCHI